MQAPPTSWKPQIAHGSSPMSSVLQCDSYLAIPSVREQVPMCRLRFQNKSERQAQYNSCLARITSNKHFPPVQTI